MIGLQIIGQECLDVAALIKVSGFTLMMTCFLSRPGGGMSCVIRRAVENAHYGSPLPVIDSPVFITVYFSQYMSVFPVSSWTAGRTWPSLVTWDCKYLQIRTALS